VNQSAKPIHIEPVEFRADEPRRPPTFRRFWKSLCVVLGLVVVILIVFAVWYVFTARKITIRIEPVPDTIQINGNWPRLKVGESVLLTPGPYTLTASKDGYHKLSLAFDVKEEPANFDLAMEELPGRLSIHVHQVDGIETAITDAEVVVDDQSVGKAPVRDFLLPAGQHGIEVRAHRYLPYQTNILLAGMNHSEELRVGLIPAWAEVYIDTAPGGATVVVNGKKKGQAPVQLELLQGRHEVLLQSENYKAYTTQLIVRAHTSIRLDAVQLEHVDAFVRLESEPSEVLVTVDGTFKGNTPLKLAVRPFETHAISFSKTGYMRAAREVNLRPGETKSLMLKLEAVNAVVNIHVEPAGTELVLDGQSLGPTPEQLELTTAPHEVEIRKDGFRPYRTTITPKVGFAQDLIVSLEPARTVHVATEAPGIVTNATGYEFKKIHPGTMTMGSSRREQGRRSNETLRQIKITRPFYMGLREVTNKEYRAFRGSHNSGVIKQASLNGDVQPVVNIRWEDAALFCNWLSEKEGLPIVYERSEEQLVAKDPIPKGYRLPTEAEWVSCARTTGSEILLKFPWGNGYPPKEKTGNYADSSADEILANHLAVYHDGFEVSSSPGSFSPNHHGLFDMGGNVAEWCHDIYTIYSREPGMVFEDPTGPSEGRHHVIRGSSWKRSSIGALRLSQRSYGNEGRNDVGFRVCRYAD